MARRFSAPYQSEPVSSLATWSRNLAVFSVVAVMVSILIVRFGFLEIKPALATFFGALGLAGLSILVGLRRLCRDLAERLARHGPHPAGAPDRRRRARLPRLSRPAIPQAAADPRHHHRPDRPAALRGAGALRSGEGANPAVYAGLYSAEQQRIAYPDIETVELEVPAQRAYEVTLALVNKRKWRVVDERPPQPPRRDGRIEAIARTPIMGFREDVADPHQARRRGFARRYPLLVALFRERPRQQRRARDQADRGHQHAPPTAAKPA